MWRASREAQLFTLGNIFRVTGDLCGEFPSQRPVTRSFHVFFDLRLNKRWSKQSWGWWFDTPSRPLWRHCDGFFNLDYQRDEVLASIMVAKALVLEHQAISIQNTDSLPIIPDVSHELVGIIPSMPRKKNSFWWITNQINNT